MPHAWCRIGAAATGLALLAQKQRDRAGARRRRAPPIATLAAPRLARRQILRPHRLSRARRRWFVVGRRRRIRARGFSGDRRRSAITAPRSRPKARWALSGLTRMRRPISSTACGSHGRIGALDIGQAVVVQQGLVLGVEAIEGTDELLSGAAPIAPRGAWRRARQGREAGPGTPRRSADDRAPHRRARGGDRVAAASPSRPVRRSSSIATRSSGPLTSRPVRRRRSPIVSASRPAFIFLVAGEPSGDALGAALIAALRQRTGE